MVNLLVGLHAALGEMGIISFVWAFVEILNPTDRRTKRALIAVSIGVVLFFASWFSGGYYYLEFYGPDVKPIIKEGPQPWAHSVFTETKEHIFLFLPFLSILTLGLIYKYKDDLRERKKAKWAILSLSATIVIIGLSMAGMGYIISSAVRKTLELGIT